MDHKRHETLPDDRRTTVTLLGTAMLTIVVFAAWIGGAFRPADEVTPDRGAAGIARAGGPTTDTMGDRAIAWWQVE